MNRIARVFKTFGTVVSYIQYGTPVIPLVFYFLLKLCLILLYVSSAEKAPTGLWALLASGVNAEVLTHYPEHLLLMSTILGRLDIPLEVLVLVIAQGATVLLIAGIVRRRKIGVRESLGVTGRRYIHLVAAAAIASAVLFAAVRYPAALLNRIAGFSSGLALGLIALVAVVLESFFMYAMPFILLDGRPALDAIRRSFGFTARHFIESFLLAFVPFLLTVPTLMLSLNPQAIAFQISPEFLVQAQIAGEIMQLISTYLLVGGITVYLIETSSKREEH